MTSCPWWPPSPDGCTGCARVRRGDGCWPRPMHGPVVSPVLPVRGRAVQVRAACLRPKPGPGLCGWGMTVAKLTATATCTAFRAVLEDGGHRIGQRVLYERVGFLAALCRDLTVRLVGAWWDEASLDVLAA